MGADQEPGSPPVSPRQDGEAPVGSQKRTLRSRVSDARTRADELAQRAAERLEEERARRSSVRMALEFYEQDQARAGGLLAGGLAFRLFLWLLPFALVAVTALGFVVSFSNRPAEAVAKDAGLSAALASMVAQAVEASRRGRIFLLPLGLVLLLWAGAGVVRALRVVSGVAWGIGRRGRRGRTIVRSLSFSGVVVAMFVVAAIGSHLYGGPIASDLLVSLMLIAVDAGVVGWAMSALPHPEVGWAWNLPGALLFAVGTEILRLVTALYFAGKLGRVADLYGALGVAAVFLAWLYLVGRLFVAGVALNAAIWEQRGGRLPISEGPSTSPRPGEAAQDPAVRGSRERSTQIEEGEGYG